MGCKHEIHSYRDNLFGEYKTVFGCKKCNHSFSVIQYPYHHKEEITINFLNNNPNIISVEDAVSHVKHLLNEKELEKINDLICSSFKTNMFWATSYLGFDRYYGFTSIHPYSVSDKGHLVIMEIKFGNPYDSNKPYGYISKLHDVPKLPTLKVGDVVGGLYYHFDHIRKTKYKLWTDNATIVEINDDFVTLKYDYIHYKKQYTVSFKFSKKEVELNIARIKWTLHSKS